MCEITHDYLCKRAIRWLKNGPKKCKIVLSELVCGRCREIPDALGYEGHHTYLIECKVSRSDFLKDKHKPFRKNPCMGVGTERYYLVPKNLITIEDLPDDRWGILYCSGNTIRVIKRSEFFKEKNQNAEVNLLIKLLRSVNSLPKSVGHYISKLEYYS